MKTGEIRLEIQQETESPQIEQEGVKQEKVKRDEVKIMHEVEQNKVFFKRESEENAIKQGCLRKIPSAKTNKKTCAILLFEKMDTIVRFVEKGVVMRYVDTYSG